MSEQEAGHLGIVVEDGIMFVGAEIVGEHRIYLAGSMPNRTAEVEDFRQQAIIEFKTAMIIRYVCDVHQRVIRKLKDKGLRP